MSGKGSLKLRSSTLVDIYNDVNGFKTTAEDALYEQFKSAYKLSVTNYMRGSGSRAFKNYFKHGTINMITGLMDIVSETAMIAQLIAECFYQLEKSEKGVIAESQLDSIKSDLKGYRSTFSGMESELNQVVAEASKYISTTNLSLDDVTDSYTDVNKKLKKIATDLESMDAEILPNVEQLLERIAALSTLATNTMGHCYKDGKIQLNSTKTLTKQTWYTKQSNLALTIMLQEDPFSYEAGAVSVSEKQWAKGLCSDVYAYAGYTILGKEGEVGVENGTAFAKGAAAVFALNGYAQFTDFLRAEGEAKAVYAEGDVKIGAGDGYFGAHVSAEAGLFKANGKVILGTDEFNGFVKGDVKLLSADGKAAFEFDSKSGEYAIGVDGSATLASAKASAGFSFLDYEYKEKSDTAIKKTHKESLFKLEASAKASAGGSFALYSESKTAIETPLVNVNATSLKIDASALLGFELDVTVPQLHWKWPW